MKKVGIIPLCLQLAAVLQDESQVKEFAVSGMLIGRANLREENLMSKTIKERYELRDQIHTGGFGITWLAWKRC